MPEKKVLVIIGASLLFTLIISAVLYRNLKSEKNQVEKQAQDLLDKNGEFNAQSTDAQVADLKQSLLFLAKEVGTLKGADGVNSNLSTSYSRVSSPNLAGNLNGSADLLIRIKSLEDRVTALEQKSGVSSATSSAAASLKVQYIPLGVDTTTNDKNGTVLDTYDISLDPADFPNYSSVQLEVVMKLSEAVGDLSVEFYNYSNNSTISISDITTHATSFSAYTSQGFRLASGRKSYRLWAKSSEGYTAYIQSARLKVNY